MGRGCGNDDFTKDLTKMRNDEHRLQCACVRWLRYQHPKVLCFAIPNGGARSALTGAMLKAEGVVAGVPDLLIAEPMGCYAGLFIEMKVKPNRPSNEQKEIISRLEDAGYRVAVCYSFEEFEKVVTDYMALSCRVWQNRGIYLM